MTALAALATSQGAPAPAGVVRHYSVKEAAELLGLSIQPVYDLIARGDLVARRVPSPTGRSRKSILRVRADDLQAFMDGLEQAVPTAARRTA